LARVVASDEKKRSEGGEVARICEAQVAGGSVLMKRCSFPGWDWARASVVEFVGGRRARKSILLIEGRARRVFTMLEP
jgi:hypothetical protein